MRDFNEALARLEAMHDAAMSRADQLQAMNDVLRAELAIARNELAQYRQSTQQLAAELNVSKYEEERERHPTGFSSTY